MKKQIRKKKKKDSSIKGRHFFLALLLIFFFLFYPGDNYYSQFFSFKRDLFAENEQITDYQLKPIPYLINPYLKPDVSAEGIYILDIVSFTPILEKNAFAKFLPASTIKIITALTAYDIYSLDQILTVRRVIAEGQKMDLAINEKMTFENLLYGILVHSANDAAYVLADNYQEGFDKFITAMNVKAEEIGMKNSSFKNPAGLDEISQYTTPYDLALASRQLLANKELAKIVSTKNITISDSDFTRFHTLKNVNKLLGEIPGIGGLKTGFTAEAGEHLISLYKKNGHEFLLVILKSQDRFEDTKAIVEWIDSNTAYQTVN